MIEAFAKLLVRAELNPTHENLADIFWLARFLPAPAPPPQQPALHEAEAEAPAPVIPPEGEQLKPPVSETPPIEPASARPAIPAGELYPRVARALPRATRQAKPIRVPATKALPNALEISRALRPLARRYPSRRLFVMDDEATAERIAEGAPMTPVMRPLNERWFEADVVVDGSPSMVVWHRVVREFLDLLAQHGAFADVRRWTLSLAETGLAFRSPSGVPRRPGELKDPAARRLIFVLTDGVGEAWREDGLPSVLANWARTTPVVIVQMLPERLWPRTAIGVPSAAVWSPVPGVANAAMMIERPWWDQDDAAPVIPIVPITLEAASIQRWAEALMGAAVTAPAIIFFPGDGSAEPASARPVPDDIGLLPAEERVQRFRAMVSRQAYDLAVLLSAVPLTLPVIGLVQRELLPETRQVHLAEVFVGGIIERVTAEDVACDPEQIEFDFADGVRDILQDSLRRSETVDVLVAISKYVERHFGQALDFAALIADPEGAVALPEAVRPFARIGMQTYQRFLGHVRLPSVPGPAERARVVAKPILINVPPPPEVFVSREAELNAALEALLTLPPPATAEDPGPSLHGYIACHDTEAPLRQELETVLSQAVPSDLAIHWQDAEFRVDDQVGETAEMKLHEADLILLLISPEFLRSKLGRPEIEIARQRAVDGSALVIPIIAKECDWRSIPLGQLPVLPNDGRALGASSDATTRTMRLLELAGELEKAITGWREGKLRRQAAVQRPRVVAINGPEGIGKFTLARRLVHEPGVRERYPDGILWLGEDGQGYPRQWLRAYCEAVATRDPFDDRESVDQEEFRVLFAGRRVLFVADQRSAPDMVPTLVNHAGPRCAILRLLPGDAAVAGRSSEAFSGIEEGRPTVVVPLGPLDERSVSQIGGDRAREFAAVIEPRGNPLVVRLLHGYAQVASPSAFPPPQVFEANRRLSAEGQRVEKICRVLWGHLGGNQRSAVIRLAQLCRHRTVVDKTLLGEGWYGPDGFMAALLKVGILEDLDTAVRLHPLIRNALNAIAPADEQTAPIEAVLGISSAMDLVPYLMRQRWFREKGQEIFTATLSDVIALSPSGQAFIAILDFAAGGTGPRRYALPLKVVREDERGGSPQPEKLVARTRRGAHMDSLYEIDDEREFCRSIIEALRSGAGFATHRGGRLSCRATSALDDFREMPFEKCTPLPVEQSNKSLLVDDRLVIKLYRRLQSGPHPEIEIGRFLTEIAHYGNAPRLLGSIEWISATGSLSAVAILQEFIGNQGDGWTFTLEYLTHLLDEFDAARPPDHKNYWRLIDALAERVGELHKAFALDVDDPAFSPVPVAEADARGWEGQIVTLAAEARQRLNEVLRSGTLAGEIGATARRLLENWPQIEQRCSVPAEALAATVKTRIHGDLHLGQVIAADDDFFILDFEGDLLRSTEARRAKSSPLRDVAGIVRSLDYAGCTALNTRGEADPDLLSAQRELIGKWRQETTVHFLDAYRHAAADCRSVPQTAEAFSAVLDAFLLEKVLYEVGYEAANRPDWLRCPLATLDRLLGGRAAMGAIPEDRDLPDFAVFRDVDTPWCPEMVVIPAGDFMMGSPESEEGRSDWEGPQHKVTIGYRFALGRYPVTFDEYDHFCASTKRRKPPDQGWGRGRRPVINISWQDAVDYCDWLAQETSNHYRLPSEAEWEYAARAGTTTAYSCGDTITEKDANFDGKVGKTSELGAYPPNTWGLYEMHGNVSEWVEDLWHNNYQSQPDDGSAWTAGKSKGLSQLRVGRGGSWKSDARVLRSANRGRYGPNNRGNKRGFRVARTLS